MKRMILSLMIASVPIAAASAAITDKKVKERFETAKAPADLVACLTSATRWNGQQTVLPGLGGAQRLQFSFFGQAVTDLLVVPGERIAIELRGMSSKRLRNSIQGCL